ncbi:Nectin-4 Nectin cell adhesion molecule 4 [Collichthys lucidus]|uniref:Nectin-4 Nectin cell adhesion molecule 4 n=1 Tax=Collichthys lucidus TaxID=240159 RepID=A0A4U5V5B3_COLLU|nr:Nectin-4 Nectin cell adhesion molecule 4 [Collichthys lucidus]
MISGSSDMAGSVLGTAVSLLLLVSIIQGQDVFYEEKIEAVVGQDVRLPCIMEKRTGLHIVNIEWSKNNDQNTKLAVYSPKFGLHLFRSNVTMQIVDNSTGSYLNLPGVTEWDSGIYNCDLTTFPLGSIRRETELKIKDLMCDVSGTVENEELVSESESLELLWVTDADTGVYTLTVNTGNRRLCKEFKVTVLPATTTTRTGTDGAESELLLLLIIVPVLVLIAVAAYIYRKQSVDPDLNYASLDLKVANKHKKKNRHQQSHAQGRNKLQDQVPLRLTPPVNAFLEVEADVDAQLPSRDTSTMVSHSSIYLNSQQIAQETVEMGRERELENAGWEDSASREWEGEEESMGRKDRHGRSNGSVRTQLLDVEAIHSVTDHFISSFNHNSVQQD